jgi:hypothetical protein
MLGMWVTGSMFYNKACDFSRGLFTTVILGGYVDKSSRGRAAGTLAGPSAYPAAVRGRSAIRTFTLYWLLPR